MSDDKVQTIERTRVRNERALAAERTTPLHSAPVMQALLDEYDRLREELDYPYEEIAALRKRLDEEITKATYWAGRVFKAEAERDRLREAATEVVEAWDDVIGIQKGEIKALRAALRGDK